ncbi:hypothetical protein MMC10_004682 [Thelotrema lepadinum]|nr:hypothetical protein [Thelotrema lepadinum]
MKTKTKIEKGAIDEPYPTTEGNRLQASGADEANAEADSTAPQTSNVVETRGFGEQRYPLLNSPSIQERLTPQPIPTYQGPVDAFVQDQQQPQQAESQALLDADRLASTELFSESNFVGHGQEFNRDVANQFLYSRIQPATHSAPIPSFYNPGSSGGQAQPPHQTVATQRAASVFSQDNVNAMTSNAPPNFRLQSQICISLTSMANKLEEYILSELKALDFALQITKEALSQMNKFLDMDKGPLTFRSLALFHVAISQTTTLLAPSITYTFSGGLLNSGANTSPSSAHDSLDFKRRLFGGVGSNLFATHVQEHQINQARVVWNELEACVAFVNRLREEENKRAQSDHTLRPVEEDFAGNTKELNQNIQNMFDLLPQMQTNASQPAK